MSEDQPIIPASLSAVAKRRLRMRLWRNIPASLQLLRLMADQGGITSQQGVAHLGCPLQTARNALGKLVRQKRATVVRGESKFEFATYTITPKGCAALDENAAVTGFDEVDDEETERAFAAQEAADRRSSIERNIERARRRMVPCSVFDLGRCVSAGARA